MTTNKNRHNEHYKTMSQMQKIADSFEDKEILNLFCERVDNLTSGQDVFSYFQRRQDRTFGVIPEEFQRINDARDQLLKLKLAHAFSTQIQQHDSNCNYQFRFIQILQSQGKIDVNDYKVPANTIQESIEAPYLQ